MRDRTTLIIAHRTTTLASAERVVVLSDGGVAEEGTHAELLSRGGIYARLYEQQLIRERTEEDSNGEAAPGSDGAVADGEGAR
jgi:ABC-type transport system involved in cytochrome bd biosynthesis fused ATPase/permease subunit